MARFTADTADHYGGQGNGGGFFFLKDDGDIARVRFLYEKSEDIEGLAVHEVQIDGKRRYVNCLREYGQPLETCPFCANYMKQQAKVFVPIYDEDAKSVKVWERGKQFLAKLSSMSARYGNLVNHVMEIERHGKAGSTETTYEIYEIEKDETTLKDLPDLPNVLGGIVLDKTAEEMNYYLDNNRFPDSESSSESREETPRRRTPSTNRRDSF